MIPEKRTQAVEELTTPCAGQYYPWYSRHAVKAAGWCFPGIVLLACSSTLD